MKRSKTNGRYLRRDAGWWSALLSEQAESGLSVKSFCEERGISMGTYYRWQKLLKQQAGDLFSPIELGAKSVCEVVVDLPSGVSLRFSELPPVGYLRSLSSSFSLGEI